MSSSIFQLFPVLDPATDAALRESIRRFGVLVPVAKDQHGRVLDGHQRSRIAGELGVDFRVDIHVCDSDDEARAIAHTLNADRRQMSVEQRREVVAALREQGHSLRAIAGAVGVDPATIHRDLSGVADATAPDRIVGKDGKRYRAKRTVVAAKSTREADRAQDALAGIEQLPANVIDVKRAERLARESQVDQLRRRPVDIEAALELGVRHGDFRDVLADLAGTVDAIITDPPYEREFICGWPHQLEALAEIASTILKPSGHLVVMMGQAFLPDVYDQLGKHMTYRWTGCYFTPGPKTRVHGANVSTGWKPILVYSRPGDIPSSSKHNMVTDVFSSGGDDKNHHHWGQSESGTARLVETLTNPGDLVVDPFLGGGTTAIVCRDLGRRFIGCDIDAAAVHATLNRLAA